MTCLLDIDFETNCSRCKSHFSDWNNYKIGINITKGGCQEVICPSCDLIESINDYKKTGTMTSRLTISAVLACSYFERGSSNSLLESVYDTHKALFLEINKKDQEITARGSEWEIKNWFGSLQNYYRNTSDRGHNGLTATYKLLLWGCAGRVLVTLQDRYPSGNPKSKYNGAWITLIFDEDSQTPRGGIQGYCATFEEAMGLLNDSYHKLPKKMRANENVRLAGL